MCLNDEMKIVGVCSRGPSDATNERCTWPVHCVILCLEPLPLPSFYNYTHIRMRMLLGLSEALPSLVEAKFRSARATQSLVFSPTELTIIRTTTGVPVSLPRLLLMLVSNAEQFQFRYCPALAKKPEPQKEKEQAAPAKKHDPFDNPDHDLLIADIPTAHPTHFLVLNKFPIITEHFILVTKTNKQQTHILERDDLETTYACLKAWQDSEPRDSHRRLFAFFNSGEHSGASQPRRHLQFLPVENMKEDQRSNSWDVLIDSILSSPALSTKGISVKLLIANKTAEAARRCPI